jgi:hypothetical protein
MAHGSRFSPLISLLMFGACTTLPTAPSVMALPGAGKTLAEFRADDYACRQFASVEASGGVMAGAAAGTSVSPDATHDAQRSYDGAYMQCMYAKGHKVPVGGALPSVNPPADYMPLYPPPPPR